MAKFRPGPGLDARIAQRFAVPHARRLADALADRMRDNAPEAAAWITAQDERVRPTHRDADGQTVPDNLRFWIEKPSGGHESAQAPRDPDLSIENRANCRCLAVDLPGVIAERVQAGDVALRGPRATASVSVAFPRIVESEHPSGGESGGGWVRRSIEETAASSVARGR